MQYCRGVCNPLLAVDEVDHLLALLGQRDVPVVGSGVFSDAARYDQSLPQLRAPRSVVAIHTGLHYVVADVRRLPPPAAATATLYDGLNPEGRLDRRSQSGFVAGAALREAFELANNGEKLGAVRDGGCVLQNDSVTCGLHAVYNAAFLSAGLSPADVQHRDTATAADVMVDIARAARSLRANACGCPECQAKRAVRGFARLFLSLARRLMTPASLGDGLQYARRHCQVEEDGEVLPVQLPVAKPTSDHKAFMFRTITRWKNAKRRVDNAAYAAAARAEAAAARGAVADAAALVSQAARTVDDAPRGMDLDASSSSSDLEDSGESHSESGSSEEDGERDWLTVTRPRGRRRRRRRRRQHASRSSSSASPSAQSDELDEDDLAAVADSDMPRTTLRGRYATLISRARDASTAAAGHLAAQEVNAAAARAAADEAGRAAEQHLLRGGDALPTPEDEQLTGSAALHLVRRRLGSAPVTTSLGCSSAGAARASGVATQRLSGFRSTNTLNQARKDMTLAFQRNALHASTAATRRADHGDQLRARAAALAEAAEEASRLRDAAAEAAQNAAVELDELLQQADERARSSGGSGPSGRPPVACRLLARRVPFFERHVRLSRKAAAERSCRSEADAAAYVTALHRLHVGIMMHRCRRCRARFWDGEKLKHQKKGTHRVEYSTCCSKGDVDLQRREAFPEPLMSLVRGDTAASKAFLDKFRSYQSAFQAASTGIKNVTLNGPHSAFTVQGKLYHSLATSATPEDGKPETFMQIYTLDDQAAAVRRGQLFEGLDGDVLSKLTRMMTDHNPYAHQFKALRDASTPSATLVLQTPESRTVNGNDARTYRAPAASEVAVLILGDEDGQRRGREVIVHKVQGDHPDGYAVQRIPTTDAAFMPLHFMLLCPRGESGWNLDMYRVSDAGDVMDVGEICDGARGGKRRRLTPMDWASFYLAVRGDNTQEENPLHCCKRGFGEWCCETFALQEEQRLSFLARGDMQKKLRRTSFDHISSGNASVGEQVGQRVVLPASHKGSWRNMYGRYCDAMALVRRYGKPSFFITFTCNPEWPEIRAALLPGQEPKDRPDLVARVFNLKLQELMNDLTKEEVLGRVLAHTYVIEYQKRGLPHAHILLLMAPGDVPTTSEQIDASVTAELPDASTHPSLHKTVIKSMIHGPCGALNPSCPCMVDGKCSKGFPRDFASETTTGNMAKVLYRRRDNGRKTEIKGVSMDNRWVVPYNPYLSTKYDAHINVEVATSVQSVKYLYKYIYKGHDRALWEVRSTARAADEPRDEIREFQDGRYIGACEAVWRTFGFSTGTIAPTVMRLDLHLPGEETVYVQADEDLALRSLAGPPKTRLTAYFDYVRDHPGDTLASTLRYVDFPEHYRWHATSKTWSRRKTRKFNVGRVFTAGIRDMEKYCLRMLLHNVCGATSFESLRTVDDVVLPTFKEAATALGLLADDAEWDNALDEALHFFMPAKGRELFAVILEFEKVMDARGLWDKYKEQLSEDILRDQQRQHQGTVNAADVENLCLLEMHHLLAHLNKPLESFGLPAVDFERAGPGSESRAMEQELRYDAQVQQGIVSTKTSMMNAAQRAAYDAVRAALDAVANDTATTGKCFFRSVISCNLNQKFPATRSSRDSGLVTSFAMLISSPQRKHAI